MKIVACDVCGCTINSPIPRRESSRAIIFLGYDGKVKFSYDICKECSAKALEFMGMKEEADDMRKQEL